MFKSLLKPFQRTEKPSSPDSSGTAKAQALVQAGNAAEDAGRLDEAQGLYQQAVALAPQLPAAHLNLGIAQEALGHAEAARASYQKVLALEPGHAFGAYNLGKLEYVGGRLRHAETLLRQAVAAKPDFHDAWVLLSNALDDLHDLQGAADAMEHALKLKPDYAGALFNHADILRRLDRLDEAEACAARAAALEPGNLSALATHSAILSLQGLCAEALEPLRRAIALAPHQIDLRAKELFLLNHVEGLSAQEIFRRHREVGALIEDMVPGRAHPRLDAGKPRLRLGFLSGELHTHPVALFLVPLLEHLDRRRFEVVCYHGGLRKDHTSERLQALSDRWVDAGDWNDSRLAGVIAADRVDVLIDLDGYTSNARLAVFAARAAPVQVTWVGYLNTTGLTRMDYRLTDARCDPPAVAQSLHTEKLLLLPHSQWCYRPFIDVAPAPAAPCERNGYITFGSLNNASKLNAETARRWGRMLQALPDARLVVVGVASEKKKQSLLAALGESEGVRERVRFAPRTDLPGYFGLINQIDIALDTFPYGGGTTTFDALWMGVPVLTVAGSTSCSRSAASLLAVLGMEEWIAPGVDQLEALGIKRARDTVAIARLRRTLRERLRASPLMDEAGFAAAFQAALGQAWLESATTRQDPIV
jgi:protein O-GlcNAc transferase